MSSKGRYGVTTGPNKASTNVLRGKDKLRLPHAGTADNPIAPSQEATRRALASFMCPFCGAGPWKNLGSHINPAHGLSADEVKEMAGWTMNTTLMVPELTNHFKRLRMGQRLPESAYKRLPGKRRKFSTAGREVQRAKLEDARERMDVGKIGREARVKRLSVEVWPDLDAEVLRRYKQGELVADIAAVVGVSKPTVKRSLQRGGVTEDLRGRAKQIERIDLGRMQGAAQAATVRRTREKVDRFHALGGDWAALLALADELGHDRKSVRALLVKHGVNIDGRRRP